MEAIHVMTRILRLAEILSAGERRTANELLFARISYRRNRIRYYWRSPEAEASVLRLMGNLQAHRDTEGPLLSQYSPTANMDGHFAPAGLKNRMRRELVLANVKSGIALTGRACRGGTGLDGNLLTALTKREFLHEISRCSSRSLLIHTIDRSASLR